MLKRLLGVFMSLVLVFSLIGCTSSINGDKNTLKEIKNEKTAVNKKEKKLEKMSIVLDWYPNAIHAFLYNAIEKGYFKEQGIELEIKFPSNPTDGISMPAVGKADFGIYYMHTLIKAKADEGVKVKSIGALVQTPLNVLLSLKEKNIKVPKDLEGKKVGYAGMDLSVATIKQMMKNAGADPSKTEFIDVGFELMSALTTGSVDVTTDNVENHELPMVEKKGFKVNTLYPKDYGIPNYYAMIIVSGEKTLKEKPKLVKGFLIAIKKGFEDMKSLKEESLDRLMANQNKENFELDKEVEAKSLDILLPKMQPNGKEFLQQDESVWSENIKWMKELGFLENDIQAKDLIYNVQ